MLDVSLVGTGGMVPMPKRFLSSMIARLNGRMLLVDCGEGTQVSLKNLGWGFKTIDAILFTHYHADHISGLPGMLHAINNTGREEPLKLIGPKGLVIVVDALRVIAPELNFDVEYIVLDEEQNKFFVSDIEIDYIFVEHSVKCVAYKFEVYRKGQFQVEKARALNLPKNLWGKIQKEGKAIFEGKEYTEDMVLGEPRRGIKVSYCTDSRPVKRLVDFAKNSDLFVCEGMYGEDEKLQKAKENKHMVFSEAAKIAKEADVKELWLTHFSPSLNDPEHFIKNATDIFSNTKVGYDNMTTNILFKD